MPTLAAGSYWEGKLAPDPDWRNDQALFDFVTEISDRDTPAATGAAKLDAYADAIPAAERPAKFGRLFAAITDQVNDERSDLIVRLKRLGQRQQAMSATVAKLSDAADRPGADQAVAEQRDFAVRAYQAMQQTMRYACETPTDLEQRIGLYARTLAAKLPKSP